MGVLRRFLVYVTKDLGGEAKYVDAVTFCNQGESVIRVKVVYQGAFTRTGLEKYVKGIRLIFNDGVIVGEGNESTPILSLSSGQCIKGTLMYYIDPEITTQLNPVRVNLIKKGLMFIAGYQFDVVTVD
ncbi:hypothetical protein [Caldivirga maquilingensis]|uniref:Uncharacterized protein n=1 Tax=Caldivirga maquilingensis (strain ATCC 700844 / DSM 13496 / JCM 10307 / IC-167) TaxID=397948 RepID=A8MDE7_CALMQ|nr:hypothetical protein [Caldivirga maquilingensis]ABW01803.1 hypothetical protein Cmaq_0971 [Caldivirga maquilingensis IC-167]